MNTIEILKNELGNDKIKKLEENGLLMLVEWSMIKYHEEKMKTLDLKYHLPEWRSFSERRKLLNLSMYDVAKMVGCSKSTISRLERGKDVFYKTVKAINNCYSSNGV